MQIINVLDVIGAFDFWRRLVLLTSGFVGFQLDLLNLSNGIKVPFDWMCTICQHDGFGNETMVKGEGNFFLADLSIAQTLSVSNAVSFDSVHHTSFLLGPQTSIIGSALVERWQSKWLY